MSSTQFLAMPDGRRIAFRKREGTGPAIVFLPGYMSDMEGSKATSLYQWAQATGRACLLLDYSGCGASPGDFAEGTLTHWSDEVLALVEAEVEGPVILVGSSMGGWLMLLCARKLGRRVAALVGIAAAPDFTDWGFDEAAKTRLAAGDTHYIDNPYGPEPTPIHAKFWHDAEMQRQLQDEIPLDCPVRLLHGQADAEVPWEIALSTAAELRSEDVQVILVKDGDHRLSRDSDIALLLNTIAAIA